MALCHPLGGGDPVDNYPFFELRIIVWIPAFAGMTYEGNKSLFK